MLLSNDPNFGDSHELVLLVERALAEQPETATARIDIVARGRTVVLSGRVSSRAAKEAAERAARGVPGVADVENELEEE